MGFSIYTYVISSKIYYPWHNALTVPNKLPHSQACGSYADYDQIQAQMSKFYGHRPIDHGPSVFVYINHKRLQLSSSV